LLEFAIEGARFAGFLIAAEEKVDQDSQDKCFKHSFRVGATSDSPVGGWGYLEHMVTKRRKQLNLLVCPGCLAVGTLRKIMYGMPDPETFDFEKYAVGGCCMNGDGSDPDISCRACEWSGIRDLQFVE
jgi:hypothetical protein